MNTNKQQKKKKTRKGKKNKRDREKRKKKRTAEYCHIAAHVKNSQTIHKKLF